MVELGYSVMEGTFSCRYELLLEVAVGDCFVLRELAAGSSDIIGADNDIMMSSPTPMPRIRVPQPHVITAILTSRP